MNRKRPTLFRGRNFEDVIIMLCVRWYLRYSLSYRDLEEIMEERGLSVDHVTIWRWVLRYAPILNRRMRREVRHPNRSWRVDETYVRALPASGATSIAQWIRRGRPSISCFRRTAICSQPNYSCGSPCRARAGSDRG